MKQNGEIPIFRTFLAKFSMFAYNSMKIGYFELEDDNDVTVTSYLERLCLFWYVWKEEFYKNNESLQFWILIINGHPVL